jgi:hypothetical protein
MLTTHPAFFRGQIYRKVYELSVLKVYVQKHLIAMGALVLNFNQITWRLNASEKMLWYNGA